MTSEPSHADLHDPVAGTRPAWAGRWPLACLLALALLAGGCASTPGLLVLHGVAREGPGSPPSYVDATPQQARDGLRIERDGRTLDPQPGLPLATGDVVETLPATVAVIRFPDGHEAIVLPGSRVRLGSLFAERGNVFVRVFERARDRFKVRTRYVTAGVEGTSFWVRVEAGDRLTVGVTEGLVVLSAEDGRWPAVPVLPNEVAVAVGAGAPSKSQVERAQLDGIVRQVSRIRLAPLVPRLPSR